MRPHGDIDRLRKQKLDLPNRVTKFHDLQLQTSRPPYDPDTSTQKQTMGAYYDEIEIEDMVWDEDKGVFHYPCPCGDRFEISRRQLADCEDIATCPSCSLIIRIIYDPVRYCVCNFMVWPDAPVLSLISKTNQGMRMRMKETALKTRIPRATRRPLKTLWNTYRLVRPTSSLS